MRSSRSSSQGRGPLGLSVFQFCSSIGCAHEFQLKINRNISLIELLVSYSKQSPTSKINRNISRVSRFRFPCSLFDIAILIAIFKQNQGVSTSVRQGYFFFSNSFTSFTSFTSSTSSTSPAPSASRTQRRRAIRAPGSLQGNRRIAKPAILCRRGGRWRGLVPPVHLSHQHENYECHDQEIYHGIQKQSVIDRRRPRCLGLRQRFIRIPRNIQKQVRKIHLAQHAPERRHQHIRNQRRNDFSKRRSYDDAHSHVEDISTHRERLEFFEHDFSSLIFFLGSARRPSKCLTLCSRRAHPRLGPVGPARRPQPPPANPYR